MFKEHERQRPRYFAIMLLMTFKNIKQTAIYCNMKLRYFSSSQYLGIRKAFTTNKRISRSLSALMFAESSLPHFVNSVMFKNANPNVSQCSLKSVVKSSKFTSP